MKKFPRTEPEIIALAGQMASGLDANVALFAAPPATFETIADGVSAYNAAVDSMVTARAASLAATTTKNNALSSLVNNMRKNIRYAENLTDYDHDQLSLIGWAGPREGTPVEAPGNPPLLTVTAEGPGDISLSWERPVTGGKPMSYLVERREQGTDTWSLTTVSLDRSVTLTEQPRGQSLEYRIVSMNRGGTSAGSNAVAAVL